MFLKLSSVSNVYIMTPNRLLSTIDGNVEFVHSQYSRILSSQVSIQFLCPTKWSIYLLWHHVHGDNCAFNKAVQVPRKHIMDNTIDPFTCKKPISTSSDLRKRLKIISFSWSQFRMVLKLLSLVELQLTENMLHMEAMN